MPIKVVLADDSDVMRTAIRKTLNEDPNIQVVGEASSFATAIQMIADFKPDVLLLDLHLPQKWEFDADFVKRQLGSVKCTVAVSFANDTDSKILAESYGAVTLLEKMKLYVELLPAIERCCPSPRHDICDAATKPLNTN